jgi:hypothetical protein
MSHAQKNREIVDDTVVMLTINEINVTTVLQMKFILKILKIWKRSLYIILAFI